MSDSVYALIAFAARYWFAALGLVVIGGAVYWLYKDADRVARVQRRLPDAGFIGEWAVVASDAPGMPAGMVMRAPRDGWIGSARACDVRLKDVGVPARAARFYLRPDGLHMLPERSDSLLVDGEPVRREAVLRHGATLTVGGVTLQLRLFAGVVLTGETTEKKRRRKKQAPVEPVYADETEQLYVETDEGSGGPPPRLELPKPVMTVKRCIRRR